MKRRSFIENFALGYGLLSTGNFPLHALVGDPDITRVVICHTNDVHSRIDPYPDDGGKNAGLGGAAKRAQFLNQLRSENDHLLLLDCGDIFQGTPYFNFFGGELEIKIMSRLKYDAGTIGNHDFDAGVEGLAKQLKHANFPILIGNYDFDNTPMKGKFKEYEIFRKGGVKIGVFGIGIELDGLVPQKDYGETKYKDPISNANRIGKILKYDHKCDYIICLSHLGYHYPNNTVSDHTLAEQSFDIDLILGGHTHTFLKEPALVANKKGKVVTINQAGHSGIMLGKIDLFFEKNKKDKCLTCKNLVVK